MREYLKDMRQKHKMSMQEVADAIGISRQYYEMIENGKRQKRMDITLISALAKAFSVSPEVILDNEMKISEKEYANV